MSEAQIHWDSKVLVVYQERILAWFVNNGRHLPWREAASPFQVLVAEILLRKTGAAHIVATYTELIAKFPSPDEMASADPLEVERIIAPLGLRKRANGLVELSQLLCQRFGGTVPSEEVSLRELPGVGPYIAAAVLCFAFGQDKGLVDGGVGRIIRRVFGLPTTKPAYLDRDLWAFAARILPTGRARQYNMALIDLGAALCRPTKPLCASCPLRELCGYSRART
jgi:A/G-specific adenine glycosylase